MASSSSSSALPIIVRDSTPTDMASISTILTQNNFFPDSVLIHGKRCLVATYQSYVIGVLVWTPLSHSRGAEADTLAVSPAYQRLYGVGRALMNKLHSRQTRGQRVKVIPKNGTEDYYRKKLCYSSDTDDMWALRKKKWKAFDKL